GSGPGVGDSPSVRRLRQVERGAACTLREPEVLGKAGHDLAAGSARPRPDENGALLLAQTLAEVAVLDLRHAALRGADARRDDLGPCAAGGAQPEVDDRSALDDRVVPEHDDELRLADRRERRSETVERRADRLWEQR